MWAFPQKIPHVACRCENSEGRQVYFLQEYLEPIAQSHPTLCDPMDCSLPGSSIHEIFQASVLEWVAISLLAGILITFNMPKITVICPDQTYKVAFPLPHLTQIPISILH